MSTPYVFTVDDDELNDDKTDQSTMFNCYKLNLPASASILSKQIAKSQAKRAKKEERSRRRVDLSTVREQDESKLSTGATSEENRSPLPPISANMGRARIDSAPEGVKMMQNGQNSPKMTPKPEKPVEKEPIDEEEARLLAMLLSGIEANRMPSGAKVSEWLLERSASPDDVSVVSSMMLEDSGMVFNDPEEENEEEDVFFDAEDVVDGVDGCVGVVGGNGVEHEMQGLSLNRNIAAMTQSLVRVEEETTDGGVRNMRSSSVSPRPEPTQQFVRNSNGSATFNVKHSKTLTNRQPNGNFPTPMMTSTPVARMTRSVLRVHNVNANTTNGTPRAPSSVSSVKSSSATPSNLEGLQDLIHMQEEALRRAALGAANLEPVERKMSWHSDQEANRQSTSTHSSLGSLSSSKSIDGAHALSKMGNSRIPTPRSRLPTPRGSTLPKRVHSVAAAVRFSASQSQHAGNSNDECF